MAQKNQRYVTTMEYQGVADFSNIINQLKSLRAQVEKNASSTDLLGIDKQFKKITELQTRLQIASEKGFSNPQEFQEFEKNGRELLKIASNLNSQFQSIHIEGLDKQLDEAKKALKESKNQLDQIVKTQQQQIAGELKGVQNGKKYAETLVTAAQEGKELKDVQADITKELDNQIKKQKDLQAQAQVRATLANQELTDVNNRAQSLTTGGKLNVSSFKNKDGTPIITDKNNEEQKARYEAIKAAYASAVGSSQKASTALQKFIAALKEQNIELKNAETGLKAFERSFEILSNETVEPKKKIEIAEIQLKRADTSLKKAEDAKVTVTAVMNTDQVAEGYKQINKAAEDFQDKTVKVGQAAGERLNAELLPAVKQVDDGIHKASESFTEYGQTIKDANAQEQELNQTFDNLKSVVKDVLSLTTAWRALREVIVQTFHDVQSLDKAFAEIAMVTDYSVNDMWASYDDYVQMAKDLGQTTESVIKASGLFYQQGLETAEALELTESTMKLATLAGLDFKQATSEMTAALRGFHMEMNQGEHITDVYSELAAKAAADVEGIAYAISKTASIASSAGMSFENTSAFLTQMIETTQEAPRLKLIA